MTVGQIFNKSITRLPLYTKALNGIIHHTGQNKGLESFSICSILINKKGNTEEMKKFGESYLDSKKLFEVYWVDMGAARSIKKVVEWCRSNGMINPITGKPPTRMGVWKGIYRWALKNQDEAYAIAQKGVSQHGDFITPEEWKLNMARKVGTSWQNDNFTKKWEKENA